MGISKKLLLERQEYKTGSVVVPEWRAMSDDPDQDPTVYFRELSAAEVEAVGVGMTNAQGAADLSKAPSYVYRTVVWCIQDEDGESLLSEKDIPALKAQPGHFYMGVQRVANAIFELSGLSVEESEELPN